jgi:hypothetical protein
MLKNGSGCFDLTLLGSCAAFVSQTLACDVVKSRHTLSIVPGTTGRQIKSEDIFYASKKRDYIFRVAKINMDMPLSSSIRW